MGKRQRRRSRAGGDASAPAATTEYRDAEGNALELRQSVSAGTAAKLREPAGSAAASADDLWRRRSEMLFERFTASWTIAGLPLTGQAELLARYRMADQETQRWVRETLQEHLRSHQPELL